MNTAPNIHHHDFTMTTSVRTQHKYQVTEWSHPDEVLPNTQWGGITYDRWIRCEIGRWATKDDFGIWIEKQKNTDYIALFAYRNSSTVDVNPEQ